MRAALVVAWFVVAAGCTGSSQASVKSSSPPPPAAPPTVTVDTGSIAGNVTNEERQPIVGARVALLDNQNQTVSDEAGAFVFNGLAPGKYRLAVETLGYASVARSVEVAAGQVVPITFVLKAVDVTKEPVLDMVPFKGIIQCSVNPYYALNPCDGITGKDTSVFHFDVNRNMTWKGAVFELVWTPTTPATAQELEFDVCEWVTAPTTPLLCADADYNKYTGGPSPLSIRVTDLPIKTHQDFITGTAAAATGFSGTSYPVFQQPFTIYMTHCYFVECPDDYSAIPKT